MPLSTKKTTTLLILILVLTFCKKEEVSNTSNTNNGSALPAVIYKTYTVTTTLGGIDSMFYDLNDDQVYDLVAVRETDTMSGGNIQCFAKIYGLKEKMYFTYMRITPNFKMLDSTDIITGSAQYDWRDTLSYISGGWQGGFLPNIGFQYKITNPNFGWFHHLNGRIKESAFIRSSNVGIRMGQKK